MGTPFRVLLYAHVDLNVVDGSAYFVAGASSLLTSAPGIEVDVVSATPVRREVVVQEMVTNPAVTVIDPFRDEGLALRRPEFRTIQRMTEATAGSMLVHYVDRGRYDVVLVRSSEVAAALARSRPDLGPRLCVYVTGVVSTGRAAPEALLAGLRQLASGGATLLCQTPEMSVHLTQLLGDVAPPEAVGVMRPSVPAGAPAPPPATEGPLVAAYTGKFARAWNTVEMLTGFKQAATQAPGMRLLVAGDHFRPEPGWPTFAAEATYLLGSHPSITWVGGVTRDEARDLVAAADVGLGWRARSMDDSLELSTKILENGSLGRPTIINPTDMHRRLFGDDYPLFASSMREFVDLLVGLAGDRGPLGEAARRTADVAADHSYERVFDDVFPLLVRAASGRRDDGASDTWAAVASLVGSGRRAEVTDGWVTAWADRPSDAETLRGVASAHGASAPVERLGPFVRWRVDGAPAADGPPTASPDLLQLLDAVAVRHPPPEPVPAGAGLVVAHDRRGRVRLATPAPAPDPVGGTATAHADEQDSSRTTDLERRAAEADRLRRQYSALSTSLLGRTQLAYWRLRARLRRTLR